MLDYVNMKEFNILFTILNQSNNKIHPCYPDNMTLVEYIERNKKFINDIHFNSTLYMEAKACFGILPITEFAKKFPDFLDNVSQFVTLESLLLRMIKMTFSTTLPNDRSIEDVELLYCDIDSGHAFKTKDMMSIDEDVVKMIRSNSKIINTNIVDIHSMIYDEKIKSLHTLIYTVSRKYPDLNFGMFMITLFTDPQVNMKIVEMLSEFAC